MAGAPKGNINAEKWTLKEATEFLNKALELSVSEEYDFIGEIAKKLSYNKSIFTYLSDKYPELKQIHDNLLGNLEANCFCNSKKGKIKEATAIVNLKSNYKWKDRHDLTTDDKAITDDFDYSKLTESELLQYAAISRKLHE